jgi:hypothetical protein
MDEKAALARDAAAALLASTAPAAADDASEFFARFDRTCAKSLTDQQAFIEAAKAAGATFKFALSGRPEADIPHAWGDTSYWVMDARPRGLTLSMTAVGSDAKHSLSCIAYAPPRSSHARRRDRPYPHNHGARRTGGKA